MTETERIQKIHHEVWHDPERSTMSRAIDGNFVGDLWECANFLTNRYGKDRDTLGFLLWAAVMTQKGQLGEVLAENCLWPSDLEGVDV